MHVRFWVASGIALLLVAVNIVTMRRLWASPIFERPQKIAQSALLWLLPGSFVFVRYALEDYLPGRPGDVDDPTSVGGGGWTDGDGSIGGHGHGGGGGGDGTVGGF